jgi:hypothetical protein
MLTVATHITGVEPHVKRKVISWVRSLRAKREHSILIESLVQTCALCSGGFIFSRHAT